MHAKLKKKQIREELSKKPKLQRKRKRLKKKQ